MRSLVIVHLFGALVSANGSNFWCHKTADGLCEDNGEDHFTEQALRDFVDRVSSMPRPASTGTVDASTIKNKVLAGYQGWAGARSEWDHWAKGGGAPDPALGNEHFEMVPSVNEYPSGSLHDTKFKHNGDGSVVKLYENAAEGVVDLHFKWMKEYGMDGVLLQRFISECTKPGKSLTQRNTILQQMDAAASAHGRVYAMMWDMSGAASSWDTDIKNDWKTYVKQYASSQQYLKENGRPVVCIFGIGLSTRSEATPSKSLSLIRWLQSEGLYVIGSGPYYWRTSEHDAASGFDEVHAAFDAIMPWAVGRYNTISDFNNKVSHIEADAALASSRGQGYAPIAYAGYSYRDTNKINKIKRNAGTFFQAQIDSHLKTPGTTFYYIAMWDEVQEGTAIYKFAANHAQSAAGRDFVTADIDGVSCPGDHYITMAAQYAARARETPTPSPAPSPPAPSGQDALAVGEKLASGDKLVSAGGVAQLSMQSSDGNLVLRAGDAHVWSSHTYGHPGAELRFQKSDGNLVLYDGSSALWSSGKALGAATVQLTDSCDLVTKDSSGSVLWSLGTSCSGVELTV